MSSAVTRNSSAEFGAGFSYDSSGKLNRVTGPGLPAYVAVYSFAADSDLVSQIAYKSDASTTLASARRTFESTSSFCGCVEAARFFSSFFLLRTLCCVLTYGDWTAAEPAESKKSACRT
ncbi:MAG: hypothetical protein L6R00_15525 [Phycisphaerae bacterium]|nr:hypothetical protein [Phycisphaerae bacterium]